MKKLVFTALAIMAFSGVSMANTIADEEVVEKISVENVVALVIPTIDPCMGSFVNTYNANVNQYGTGGALAIAQAGYKACRTYLGLD